jgi:DNA polymerase III gamma/tau subunit
MSDPSRHSSSRSNRYAPLEEIVLPAPSPVTPTPALLPFFTSPAPKTEAETADIFGSHDPWADVQATPTPRRTHPSTRHASRAPTPFVPKPLNSAYHWNDQTYTTLEDVVIASGCTFGVSDNLSQWLNVVIREFTRRDVIVGYNALGDRIQAMDTRIAESMNEFETAVYGRFDSFTEHIASVQNMSENAAQTAHSRIDRLDKRVEEHTEDMDAIDENVRKLHRNLKAFTQDNSAMRSELANTRAQLQHMHTVIAELQDKLKTAKVEAYLGPNFDRPAPPPRNMDWPMEPHVDWNDAWGMPAGFQPQVPPLAAPMAPQYVQPTFQAAPVFAPASVAPAAPLAPVATPSSHTRLPHMDVPKFSGNTKDQTLEDWVMKMHVYFRHQKVTNDEDRITIALMALEGHLHLYMQEYSMAISKNLQLGTWAEFLSKLETGYKDLALEKRAQQNLDKVDSKKYTNVRSFAEDFRIWAPKSGYSNVELIARIDRKRSERLVNVMTGAKMANPALAPSTWARYLDYVLQFETKLRKNRNANGMRSHKDLDAMEVNAMRTSTRPRGEEKELNNKQKKWAKAGLCFKCGKHPRLRSKPCRNPVYEGFFKVPQEWLDLAKENKKKREKKKTVATMESQDANSLSQFCYMPLCP